MLLLFGEREAEAYVQSHSSTGAALAWMPKCLPLPIMVYPGTFSGMTIEEITGAVTGAAAAWSAGANPCTFVEFEVTVRDGPAPRPANDGIKTIIFRDTSWCPLDSTGGCDPVGGVYDPASPALATMFARTTGEIVDVDIEVNAYHFYWADRVAHPDPPEPSSYDLQNVLTQEIGHMLGLDSPCFIPGGGPTRPNDNAGQPVPDCATAPTSVQASTMFPSTTPGDVGKRTLEADDRAGVCAIYPAAANPCPSGGSACACPPPPADGGQDAGGGDDAGASTDGGPADGSSTDAGKKKSSGGGCSCETAGRSSERSWRALVFLAAAFAAITRSRRLNGDR